MDVSLGGVTIDLGSDNLQVRQKVLVSFSVRCGNQNRSCSTEAVVVYAEQDHSGLNFTTLDSSVTQMLRHFLFGYATVAQRAYLNQWGLGEKGNHQAA
jgi:hypothetical protein